MLMTSRAIEDSLKPPAGDTKTDRRHFLVGTIYTLSTVISGALGGISALYLLQPPTPKDESQWSRVGDISQLIPAVPLKVTFRRTHMEGWKRVTDADSAWIVRDSHDDLIAFAAQCTHLGCPYHWEAKRNAFVCPCHGSVFSKAGDVVVGPANRPLDRYHVKLQGSDLSIGPLIKIAGV
jgi:menaquinol-cytochrome c reductase iron-sulfur subunit